MNITKPLEVIFGKIPVGLFLFLTIVGVLYFIFPDSVGTFLNSILASIRPIFVALDAILIFIFIISLQKGLVNRPSLATKPAREKHGKRTVQIRKKIIAEQWSAVTSKFAEGTPESAKLAIIDADRLADWILKAAGVKGEHMADRLEKMAGGKLATLDQLWRAHRVRNEIVHSPDFDLPMALAERTLKDYETFLHEVKAL